MKKIIAVASGKGGVGKSTLSANLAVALAQENLKVALIDCDFYGPSIPILMGGGSLSSDNNDKFIPALKHGVKYISISFFLKNPDDPVVWRGPMFGKAIQQLFSDTNWGEVDICLVDMPPGTGDAQLSLSQLVNLDGVVMVTTPQEVSLADVRRAVNMFKKVNVEILGVVENMSGFVADDGKNYDLFGKGGGEELCKKYDLNFLGNIPLEIAIREGGDKGEPAVINESCKSRDNFKLIAKNLLDKINTTENPKISIVN